jgi:hypothetical protein
MPSSKFRRAAEVSQRVHYGAFPKQKHLPPPKAEGQIARTVCTFEQGQLVILLYSLQMLLFMTQLYLTQLLPQK